MITGAPQNSDVSAVGQLVLAGNGTNGLALDVGTKRIGVAIANLDVRFPRPLLTLENPKTFFMDITSLCQIHDVAWLVIGLPRGLSSQDTDQTKSVRAFVVDLQKYTKLSLYWIDEALTSNKAKSELRSRGKPYIKSDIDSLAATYMLEDFLNDPQNRQEIK